MPLQARLIVLVATLLGAPAAAAFVPQSATGIGPGSHLFIDVGGVTASCTAGWVFRGAAGALYLSTAGHCLLPEGKTATHGPGADAAPDASVRVCVDACTFGGQTGFVHRGQTVLLGPVAYARESHGGEGVGNDFGLVRIPPAFAALVRFGLPSWGVPSSAREMVSGDTTCYYGAGVVVGETFATMARAGIGSGSQPDGSWRMVAASAVGDSGAAVAICSRDGRASAAAGVLTHLSGGLVAGTSIARGVELARSEAGLTTVLALR